MSSPAKIQRDEAKNRLLTLAQSGQEGQNIIAQALLLQKSDRLKHAALLNVGTNVAGAFVVWPAVERTYEAIGEGNGAPAAFFGVATSALFAWRARSYVQDRFQDEDMSLDKRFGAGLKDLDEAMASSPAAIEMYETKSAGLLTDVIVAPGAAKAFARGRNLDAGPALGIA